MKPELTILKIGGNVLDEPAVLNEVLLDFANLNGAKILVHGGGKLATRLAEKLGIEAKFHEGRRITDEAMLEVAVMSYAGWINKSIVAKLQSLGLAAIGVSGADGNLILSKKRLVKAIDFGFVGDVENVNSDGLTRLLGAGFFPVFAPITHDGNGQLLNTNADTIASELAIAASRNFNVQLLYCFEKKGVLENSDDDDSVVQELNFELYSQLRRSAKIHSGMLPKLENCFRALQNGVESVKIGDIDLLKNEHSGTQILLY